MPLTEENERRLQKAQGYVELGMYLDANAALEEIDPEVRHVPEVLDVCLRNYRALGKWELMQTVAAKLARFDPDSVPWTVALAFATRRAQSIEAAKPILLDAVERLPTVAVLQYDLASLECQLGQVEVANARLAHAFKLDEKLRLRALDDADLQPLWGSL